MDFILNGNAHGNVANKLTANGRLNAGAMRPFVAKNGKAYISVHISGDPKEKTNWKTIQVNSGTLRRDEWKALDSAVQTISRERLTGIKDLTDRGLVYNLGNAMGTTVLETTTSSDAMLAEMTMDGITRSKGDRPEFNSTYLPIPIIHSDYEINARVLATSRNMGNALDVTQAEMATRKVAVKLEDLLFKGGAAFNYGGGNIYSYLNYPNKNDVTITSWTGAGKTGKQIVDDVLEMKQANIDALQFGPYMVYVPTGYETKLDEDYSDAKGSDTIRDRIKKIASIIDVKVADRLPADKVVVVQMSTSTVRLVQGMAIQNIEWQTEGNFLNMYKVLTIAVPQLRSDDDGNCGITLGAL